jgi:hypothetical protein
MRRLAQSSEVTAVAWKANGYSKACGSLRNGNRTGSFDETTSTEQQSNE